MKIIETKCQFKTTNRLKKKKTIRKKKKTMIKVENDRRNISEPESWNKLIVY